FGGFIHTGIFGLQRIFDQLSIHGNEQAAFDILNKKGDHSFERMWAQHDATTLWEILPVDSLSVYTKAMADRSHNHPMQAGFDAWFFYGIAGIRPDVASPGFKKIILQPHLIKQLEWAKGAYHSPYGEIVSNWKRS